MGYRSLRSIARVISQCEQNGCTDFAEEILTVRSLKQMDEFLRERSYPIGESQDSA
jgi:hypothetical protein